MNKVILIGRLTKDPEMRTTGNGTSVTRFTLAVSRNFVGPNGEKEADFINCISWRKQAENVAKYCSKGSQVAVEGRIQTGSYENPDGSKRYTTDVVVENVMFLKTSNNVNNFDNNQESNNGLENDKDPFESFGEEITLDENDLPF